MNIDPRLYFLLRRLKEVQTKHFFDQNICLLDVGCADGSFINLASKHLANIERIDGIDVPSKWSATASASGIGKLYIQDLQKGTGDVPLEKYHIITLWEVVEHIENVHQFLNNIRKILSQDGVILLSTPNLLSLSRFIKGKKWVGISEENHKYLFDALSLSMVLSRASFHKINVHGYYLPSLGEASDWINKSLAVLPGGGMLFAEAVKNIQKKES